MFLINLWFDLIFIESNGLDEHKRFFKTLTTESIQNPS